MVLLLKWLFCWSRPLTTTHRKTDSPLRCTFANSLCSIATLPTVHLRPDLHDNDQTAVGNQHTDRKVKRTLFSSLFWLTDWLWESVTYSVRKKLCLLWMKTATIFLKWHFVVLKAHKLDGGALRVWRTVTRGDREKNLSFFRQGKSPILHLPLFHSSLMIE